VASAACACAPDGPALIAFRFIQGAGAALLVSQIFSIIQLRFTGPARVRALSAHAAVLSGGGVTGMILGGVIVTANLFGMSWRPVFGVNVPIRIALALLVPRTIPADGRGGRAGRMDVLGGDRYVRLAGWLAGWCRPVEGVWGARTPSGGKAA
jgi:MFS family permease